ncbi:serpin family protein [soil metagenome]
MERLKANSIVAIIVISITVNLLSISACGAQIRAVVKREQVVQSTEQFGLDLFQKLSSETPGENCFISPVSVAIALNVAMFGASGATRAAMAKGLALASPNSDTAGAFSELLNLLVSSDPQVEINIANAIFVDDKFKLKPSFKQDAKLLFQSEVRNEDFSDSQTLGKINSWAAEHTKNHIPTILTKLEPRTVAVLLNAIFFKGKWTTPFARAATADGDFHLQDGGTKKVSLMNRTGQFSYYHEHDFQAVQLPYGTKRFQALVFLPSTSVNLTDFQKRITAENLNNWLSQCEQWQNSHLSLPRFHVDYGSTLNKSLQELGFGEMFSNQADFSLINTPPPELKVSQVIHKTTLDVDEEGTVATAVTALSMMSKGLVREPPPRSFNMIVDRPFVFVIRDTQTGLLLFLGSVYKPDIKINTK